MADRDIASEVLKGLREIHEHRAGKVTLRTTQVEARPLPELTPDAIRRIRASLDVSRAVFAHMIRIPVRTVEGWERGKSKTAGFRRKRSSSWPKSTRIRLIDWHHYEFVPLAPTDAFRVSNARGEGELRPAPTTQAHCRPCTDHVRKGGRLGPTRKDGNNAESAPWRPASCNSVAIVCNGCTRRRK